MHTVDGETAQPEQALTYEQLHEQACIVCGAADDLVPAGHREVDGLTWAVAACREHVGEVS